MFRNFAMIDKVTNEIITIIVVDWSYVFTDDYIWADTADYSVGIGDYYIDGKFYSEDKTTEITKNPTEKEQLNEQLQCLTEQNTILQQESLDTNEILLEMQYQQSINELGGLE